MGINLVDRGIRALADQLNEYYRVLKGVDPDSVYVRLNPGGSVEVRHSSTNAAVFHVDDNGATGTITPSNGSITNAKLAPDAVTTDKIANGTIVDADISPTAGIAGSKLAGLSVGAAQLTDGSVTSAKIADGTIADADVAAAGTANIAVAKLAHVGAGNVLRSNGSANVGGQLVNGDVAAAAAIAYSKLALAASIVNADIAAAAAIAYSKLALAGSIVNNDIAAAAAIALSKLAAGSAGVLKSNGSVISAGNLIVTSDMGVNTINGDRLADGTVPGAKISGGAPPPNGGGAVDAWKVYATGAAGTTVSLQQVVSAMIADGTIAMADLAANAATKVWYAGTGSVTNSATTPVLVVTINTPDWQGGPGFAVWTPYANHSQLNSQIQLLYNTDGSSNVSMALGQAFVASVAIPIAGCVPIVGVGAGNHNHNFLVQMSAGVNWTLAGGSVILVELRR